MRAPACPDGIQTPRSLRSSGEPDGGRQGNVAPKRARLLPCECADPERACRPPAVPCAVQGREGPFIGAPADSVFTAHRPGQHDSHPPSPAPSEKARPCREGAGCNLGGGAGASPFNPAPFPQQLVWEDSSVLQRLLDGTRIPVTTPVGTVIDDNKNNPSCQARLSPSSSRLHGTVG